MKSIVHWLVIGLLAAAPAAGAGSGGKGFPNMLQQFLPGLDADRVRPSPVPGLYEVQFGPNLVYISEDGRYLIQGRIIDLEKQRDITAPREAAIRLEAIEKIGEDNMIVFAPKEVRHTVTVFTDIDCGYCQRLHARIDDYNARGIRVRYIPYPRSRVGGPSYQRAVNVWCAEDRKRALTRAKAGQPVPERSCDNPVAEGMELGQRLGVRGTPTIVTDEGRLIGGYVPPARLAQILESDKARQARAPVSGGD